METALAHSQGRMRKGILLTAPTSSKMFTRVFTKNIEKMEMSRLVTCRPSRRPPVSMVDDVRYHVNILRYRRQFPIPIKIVPDLRVKQKQQLLTGETSIFWQFLDLSNPCIRATRSPADMSSILVILLVFFKDFLCFKTARNSQV
eukprot:GFUD01082167.1.p1 GENE.GFUD01082167.1~~GFUD01082167.1.p1  ORF type:complete len:163 (-),score=40.22 GFUD01082167.1:180-614(-)